MQGSDEQDKQNKAEPENAENVSPASDGSNTSTASTSDNSGSAVGTSKESSLNVKKSSEVQPKIKASSKEHANSKSRLLMTFVLWGLVAALMAGSYFLYLQTTLLSNTVNNLKFAQNALNSKSDTTLATLDAIGKKQASSHSELTRIEDQQSTQKNQLVFVSEQLASLTGIRRQDWEVARLEYLLKLASQRLQLDGDLEGARATLVTADEYLTLLDDPKLLNVRKQVSKDLLLLNSSNAVDQSGLYLSLDSMIQEIPTLQPAQPEFEVFESAVPEGISDSFVDWLLYKFKDFFRHTSTDVKPSMNWLNSETRGQFNNMLILRLMHAQQALMAGNQAVYDTALLQAQSIVERAYLGRPQSKAFIEEISKLRQAKIVLSDVDISGSHQALQVYLEEIQQSMRDAVVRKLVEPGAAKQQGSN